METFEEKVQKAQEAWNIAIRPISKVLWCSDDVLPALRAALRAAGVEDDKP
jgi:hypothetical protein